MSVSSVSLPSAPNTPVSEIQEAFHRQQQHKQQVKNMSVDARLKKAQALSQWITRHRKDIQDALYADFKKPPIQTDFTEIYPVTSEIKHYRENLHEWMAEKEVDTPLVFFGSSASIVTEPKGNVLVLSPWNYPFQISLKNAIGAFLAGNTVIIKPSEFTPHTSAIIKRAVQENFPAEEMLVIEGDHTVATALLQLRFNHIHFTGSPAVGKMIMKAAAENLTTITLELGGKTPVIVDETADLKQAVHNLIFAKYTNNGQTCIAADYILVHENNKDRFVEMLAEEIRKTIGDGRAEGGQNCVMVNQRHYQRVKRLLEDALQKGARVYSGGQLDESDRYIAPTLLTDVPPNALIMQEEIFGPLLPIITYKNLDEAIARINQGETPLALYIYSKSSKNKKQIIQNTTAGATLINESLIHNGHPNLPFGGLNNSGIGKSHGYFGFKEFTHERPIVRAWNAPSKLLTPPYNGFKRKVVDFMLKYL